MKSSKKWMISFICIFLTILIVVGAFMVVVDPYFHFHKPIAGLQYSLQNERYQNNGIVKHFEYDAIITGSSMTECFKTSQMDEIFGVKSIKVPYSGGSYREVNENLQVATQYNKDIKVVVRCLDAMRFFDDKDYLDYTDYPTYLYDENVLNDVNYIYNVEILLVALQNMIGVNRNGALEINFDEYANWNSYYNFGLDAVMANYNWKSLEVAQEMLPFTDEESERLRANIEQNVIALAKENPQIDFYIYISPYSIYCMDYWWRMGELEKRLLAERQVIEMLIPYENIHICSFNTEHEVLNNPDNYRDIAHHSEEVNTQILHWLYEGKHEITAENFETYCNEVWDYYMNFDYNSLYE